MNDNSSISGCCINVTTRRWAFCPWDGTPLQDGWAHCPKCGAAIGQQAVPAVIPANPWFVPMFHPPTITWGGGIQEVFGSAYQPRGDEQVAFT